LYEKRSALSFTEGCAQPNTEGSAYSHMKDWPTFTHRDQPYRTRSDELMMVRYARHGAPWENRGPGSVQRVHGKGLSDTLEIMIK
jgi:hypothetical protein